MELTMEQTDAIIDGYVREKQLRCNAHDAARKALAGACDKCWFRLSGGGCEGSRCSIHRLFTELEKMTRMIHKGKLDDWDWDRQAKDNDRLMFVDTKESQA